MRAEIARANEEWILATSEASSKVTEQRRPKIRCVPSLQILTPFATNAVRSSCPALVFRSPHPLTLPSFSANGGGIAYRSFADRRGLMLLDDGRPTRVRSHPLRTNLGENIVEQWEELCDEAPRGSQREGGNKVILGSLELFDKKVSHSQLEFASPPRTRSHLAPRRPVRGFSATSSVFGTWTRALCGRWAPRGSG